MNSDLLKWLLGIIICIFIYKFAIHFWKGFVDGFQGRVPEVEEFRADKLLVKIYFGRQARSASADLREWERTGVIRVTAFVTELPKNELERQAEGKWANAGPAIVRIRKGTDEVVSWQLIR